MNNYKTFICESTLLLLLMCLPLQTFGQTNDSVQVCENDSVPSNIVEYCETSDDFYADRWTSTDKITIDTTGLNLQPWWAYGPIKYSTKDKALKKKLQKEYFAIRYNNALYINTYFYEDRGVKFDKNYSRVVKMKDGKLFLPFMNVVSISRGQAFGAMGGLMGGLMVGLMTSAYISKKAKEMVCYIITPGDVDALFLDDKVMQEMLSGNADLLEKYMSEKKKKKRIKAINVIPLIEEMGLLIE